MAMTAAELATVRRRIGDNLTTYALSDTELNAIYDSTTTGNSDLNRTTYFALLELWGMAIGLVDKSNEVDSLSLSSSQKFDHLEKLLTYWGGVTGLGNVYDPAIAEGGLAAPCGELVPCP